MKALFSCGALTLSLLAGSAQAMPITDFTGVNVGASLSLLPGSNPSFSASLNSTGPVAIGSGTEYIVSLAFSGAGSGDLYIDFDDTGRVVAGANDGQFVLGLFSSGSDYGFDLTFDFPDPGFVLDSATTGGQIVRGSVSLPSQDPLTWQFRNERDPSFGAVMTLGVPTGNPPFIDLAASLNPVDDGPGDSGGGGGASQVPAPAGLPLLAMGLMMLVRRRSRPR